LQARARTGGVVVARRRMARRDNITIITIITTTIKSLPTAAIDATVAGVQRL